jgi:hypothetical protein
MYNNDAASAGGEMENEPRFNCWLDGALTRHAYFTKQVENEEKLARQYFENDQSMQIRVLKALCRYRMLPPHNPRRSTDIGTYEYAALTAFAAFFGNNGSILNAFKTITEFMDREDISVSKQDKMILKAVAREMEEQPSVLGHCDGTFFDEVVLKWFEGEDVLVAKLRTYIDRTMVIR